MPDDRTGKIKTSFAGHEARASDEDLGDKETSCLEIRQASSILPIGHWKKTPTEKLREFLSLPLQSGQTVYCQDGYVGKVVSLRIDHLAKIINFTVQSGHFFFRRRIVPFLWVDRIEMGSVYLSAKKSEFKILPDDRPDSQLIDDVEMALWEEGILHGIEYNGVDISARCGVIVLEGYVPNAGLKNRIEEVVRYIPGVLGIVNDLVIDEDLKIAAAMAVTRDPYDHEDRIFISSHNGFIQLSGEVSGKAARLAAEKRAGSVPHIRGVLNSLRVPGSKMVLKDQRALQPRIGAIVHTRGAAIGVIQQVILSPTNRLVVAVVVNRHISDPKEIRKSLLPQKSAMMSGKVVVPVHAIAYETGTAVFLDISDAEVSMFEDFNSQFYPVPEAGWQPPYPYHLDQIRIKRT